MGGYSGKAEIVSLTSILAVDKKDKVKRLHCPFRVLAIVDIPPDIAEGKYYMVDFVKMILELKELFKTTLWERGSSTSNINYDFFPN